jgi:hypothetical protein
MRRRIPILLLLALAAALAVVAAGCGGGSSDAEGAEVADVADESGGGGDEQKPTTTEAPEDPEEALLAFTECLREHGIDVPDPEFDDSGRGRMRMQLGESGIDPDDPKFRAAQEECRPLLASIRGQFTEEDRQRMQDAALEFARCMRGKGFDVPDPDFSGEGPGGGAVRQFFGDVDADDPKFRAAQEECSEAFEGLGGPLATDERRAGEG